MKISYNPKSSQTAITTETAANDDIIFDLYTSKLWAKGVRIGADWADISSKPSSLKNPAAITFRDVNGDAVVYDGSVAKDLTTGTYIARLPYGFSSFNSNPTWGNTTGTSIACWDDASGGSIDFRKDNPASGKLSIKVDGRVYVNAGTNPVLSAEFNNDYWGMRTPDGGNDWIRTPNNGLLPCIYGNAGSGHSSLGTNSWYFSTAYIDKVYGSLKGNADTATKASEATKLQTARNLWGNSFDGTEDISGSIVFPVIGDTAVSNRISWGGSSDGAEIYYQTIAKDQGNLVLNVKDDANAYIQLALNGAFKSHFDVANSYWTGKSALADKWATARTFTIGNTAKDVDGSGNVSWTLAEIGVRDTWRTVQVNGTSIGNNTLNLCGSAYIGLTNVNGKVTFSLVGSSTTANQAILSNGTADGWTLKTLNIANWDTAYNLRHSHANKSVLDGITSGLVTNWNTAYTFVSTITGKDTDDVINKWDEIVNFLAGIKDDDKLNTLLNRKLSIQQLSAKEVLTTKTNNALFWVNTKNAASSITTGPFTDHPYALLSVTNYNQNDTDSKFFYRSRLAFSSAGDLKVASCHHENEYKQNDAWYNVLTSKNSSIKGSTITLNGTSITVYSSDTADGRYVKKTGDTMTGALNFANATWNTVGDDVAIGDCNVAGCLGIKGLNADPGLAFYNSSNTLLSKLVGTANQFQRVSEGKTYTIIDTASPYVTHGVYVFSRSEIGNSPNYDNPGKNGLFEIRGSSEVTGETGTKPFNGWGAFLNLKTPDNVAMLQIVGSTESLYHRTRQASNVTMSGLSWKKVLDTSNSYVRDGKGVINGTTITLVDKATKSDTASKVANSLTLKANGTTLATYDGSSAKEANFTYANVGAAPSQHTHDYLVINAANDASFNSPYHNFQVLYAGGNNGITGKPEGVDAFGLFRFRVAQGWSGQMLLAHGGSLYIRSHMDECINNKLAWRQIIDSTTIGQQSVKYATSAGSATSATKVIVNQHIANDSDYPLVWSNQSNTSNVTENQLYKSWQDLYYNPKNKRLFVGGAVSTTYINATKTVTSAGFKHSGVTKNADQYVLTAGGGYTFLNQAANELAHEFDVNIEVTSEWQCIAGFHGGNQTFLTQPGTYIVQVYYENNPADGMYQGYFSGIMSWYTGTTDSNNADEIVLHRVGHAYANTIYLRTRESLKSDPDPYTKLQISANSNLKKHTYKFKFKRIC